MKNRIYKYFFYEFIRYFIVVLFALTAIIWTIQAVNYLDLVTDDGHSFKIYLFYSSLTIPKIITKLIPFSFLLASMLTILKLDKDNELIVLWSSGLNKIHIVNLVFRISLLIMLVQFFMSSYITPKTLNFSRSLLKNSKLQFVPSLLKEKEFNDTVEGLTIFVGKKNQNHGYEDIFIRDDSNVVTQISTGSSTIFAKTGYVSNNQKTLILHDGTIHKVDDNNNVINIITFSKTEIDFSDLSTKTISEPKIQETSTIDIIQCIQKKNIYLQNCNQNQNQKKDNIIEVNKRFGTPIYIPLISLISCFLLSINTGRKISPYYKYIYFSIGFLIVVISEITIRYSGISPKHTSLYYLIPILLIPLLYFSLIKKFKYENL